MGAEELVLVQHLRKHPAEPLRVDRSEDSLLRAPKVTRSRGVDALQEFGHPARALTEPSYRARVDLQ
jgi:hypothetical protein